MELFIVALEKRQHVIFLLTRWGTKMFIYSNKYKLVVYFPPSAKDGNTLSLCVWLVPGSEPEDAIYADAFGENPLPMIWPCMPVTQEEGQDLRRLAGRRCECCDGVGVPGSSGEDYGIEGFLTRP
jgi:hypothetical protein